MALLCEYSFNATGSAGGTLTAGTSITDDSGNGNTLVTQNGADTIDLVTGHTGVAVEANGLSYADVASTSAIKPTTAVTWMCWARLTDTTYAYGQIFGRNNDDPNWGDAFSFYLDGSDAINRGFVVQLGLDDTASGAYNHQILSTGGATFPALNTWTHLAATWDASDATLRLFINGSQAGTASAGLATIFYGTGGNTTRRFAIFRNTQYNEIATVIQIDDVRVFNTRLTSTEINSWMNTPAGRTPTPVAWII